MTIETVSNDFFNVRSSIVLTFSIAAYPVYLRRNKDNRRLSEKSMLINVREQHTTASQVIFNK